MPEQVINVGYKHLIEDREKFERVVAKAIALLEDSRKMSIKAGPRLDDAPALHWRIRSLLPEMYALEKALRTGYMVEVGKENKDA